MPQASPRLQANISNTYIPWFDILNSNFILKILKDGIRPLKEFLEWFTQSLCLPFPPRPHESISSSSSAWASSCDLVAPCGGFSWSLQRQLMRSVGWWDDGMMGCLVIDHHIIIVSHPVYQSIMVDSCLIYRFAREASLGCVGVWMCDTSFVEWHT